MTGADSAARSRPPRLLTLIAMSALGALATNMFLPSLPQMARHFAVDYGVMQLSVSGYLAASAVLQLLVGPVSDRYGRRPVMIWALVLFIVATIGTLMASSAGIFLAFRLMQAIAATGMVLSRAVVRDTSLPDQAASRLAYVTMGMSVVPMLAPALGGLMEQTWGWQASFVAMLLAGVGVLILVIRDLQETATGVVSRMWWKLASSALRACNVGSGQAARSRDIGTRG